MLLIQDSGEEASDLRPEASCGDFQVLADADFGLVVVGRESVEKVAAEPGILGGQ